MNLDTPHDDTRAGKVRLHRRIGVRLTIALALVLCVFSYSQFYLAVWAIKHFGEPGHKGCVYVIPSEDDEESEDLIRAEEQWAVQMADAVLAGARQDDTGRLLLSAETVRAVSDVMAMGEEAFLWLDTDARVLAASPALSWKAGEEWTFGTKSHHNIDVPEGNMRRAHVVYVPITRDDRAVGTFVLLEARPTPDEFKEFLAASSAGEDGAGAKEEPLVMSEAEYDELQKQRERIIVAMKIAISLGIALFLGGLLSLLVTRRVRRLAIDAHAVGRGSTSLPGPFDARGHDEIALLARSMNEMRSRATELLDDLRKQDVVRREWIAQVSHDLRTPLTALLACLSRAESALEGRDVDSVNREMHRLLAVARADAIRVQTLADDLIEIARLEASDPLDLEEVPPGELVQQGVLELEAMAGNEGIALDVSITRALPVLTADGRRLMRALQNLLRNALQHARRRIQVSACTHGDGVRFEVRDDGPGFPGTSGDVVLHELGRNRGRGDSAGLGLTVARRVVEAHGGQIGACNLDTTGASVWMIIPIPKDDPSADAA